MTSPAVETRADAPSLRLHDSVAELPDNILGAIVYGAGAQQECSEHPHLAAVPLTVAAGTARVEAWYTQGPVTRGSEHGVRFSNSAEHLFGIIEVRESDHPSLREAAAAAYTLLLEFSARGAFRHPWRIWNFIDAINLGENDQERYREFCQGRADVLVGKFATFPAGSALGRRDGERVIQLIWLAGREPGLGVENPRQLSAFAYPRQYGPASPSFSRAMRVGEHLLISGTASIVGHRTLHPGDTLAQLEESLENMTVVATASGVASPELRGYKAYVRHAHDIPLVADTLEKRGAAPAEACFLLADICRADLLLELEAVCQPVWGN